MTRYDEEGHARLDRGSDNGTKAKRAAAQTADHAYTKLLSRAVTILVLPVIGAIIAYFLSDMDEDRKRAVAAIEKVSTDVGDVATSVQQVTVEMVRVVQQVQELEEDTKAHEESDSESFDRLWERYGMLSNSQTGIRERISRIEGEASGRRDTWRTDPDRWRTDPEME